MNTNFDDLVRSLDQATLDLLRRSVAQEVDQRRSQSAIQLEHIHAQMTDAERREAAQEIARILKGEDPHA